MDQGLEPPFRKSKMVTHTTIDNRKLYTGNNNTTPCTEDKYQTTHKNNAFP